MISVEPAVVRMASIAGPPGHDLCMSECFGHGGFYVH